MKLITVKVVYTMLNFKNFGRVLTMPRIGFSRTRFLHGFYCEGEMLFNLADVSGVAELKELVYHEMIHQYIEEFLGLEVEDDHGKEFKKQYNKFSFGIKMDQNYVL